MNNRHRKTLAEVFANPVNGNIEWRRIEALLRRGYPTMRPMTYRGYAARVEYDAEDRIFVGRLAGIADIAVFHGTTADELETAFRETVDHYLEVSARTGVPAQAPYSGRLTLRIPPELHAAAALAAESEGTSIDQWATRRLAEAVRS